MCFPFFPHPRNLCESQKQGCAQEIPKKTLDPGLPRRRLAQGGVRARIVSGGGNGSITCEAFALSDETLQEQLGDG
jgi:hypothetical protein